MKKWLKILFVIGLFFVGIETNARQTGEQLQFFTDRGFCVSGDSVWMMLRLPEIIQNEPVVARFQIEAIGGNLIETIAKVSNDGWAEGYLVIPDSLSSGQYFLTAFLINGAGKAIEPVTKSLLVYNRFDEDISQVNIVNQNFERKKDNQTDLFQIKTDADRYKTREKVSVEIESPEELNVSEAVVRATFVDPLEKRIPEYRCNYNFSSSLVPGFIEKDGFLLSGKVTTVAGTVQPGVLVVISIAKPVSYFDYCVTDSAGIFHFFVENAFGTTEAVFQVFSNSNSKYTITLEKGALERTDSVKTETIVLSPAETGFIKNALNNSFASKIFYPASLVSKEYFSIKATDSIPFYGPPTIRIYPDEFFDLPDFREISRELLQGFQYRIKNEKIVFRMLNRTKGEYFNEEPLRLINGIPVFDNQLFVSLKSTDLNYIDLVLYERIYGDLILNGVLEVSLKDKTNAWIGNQPNLFRRNIRFLQPEKKPAYYHTSVANPNEPDTRQVFVCEKVKGKPRNLSFNLSDRKGTVEISVEGITTDNRSFKTVKTIEIE